MDEKYMPKVCTDQEEMKAVLAIYAMENMDKIMAKKKREISADGWQCKACGQVHASYVGTCGML